MRELHLILSIIALLRTAAVTTAQSVEQWIGWGDAAMERQEYYGASKFYEGALEQDPGRMVLQWKHAEASRLSNQYDKAAEHYAIVYKKDQGRTYPDALRWLAEMQMSQGLYDEAEKNWNKLIQRNKKNAFNLARAQNGLKGCELAKAELVATTSIVVEHIPRPVNTYDSEFAARIGPDDRLYLSSLRGEFNKDEEVKDTAEYRTRIYHASAENEKWTEPVPVPSSINNEGDNANISWSLDGSKAYFTRCLPGSQCRIHVLALNDPNAEVKALAGLGEEMSTQPMIMKWNDREMLLFVSDRSGSAGGTDLFQAEISGDSVHSIHPLNGKINSIGNERTPWFDPSTNTLWFSSDFLPGMGGYDIFTSTWSNDEFTEPENAGMPVNSPANDLYPYIDRQRDHFWFASNRIGSFASKGATCCSDIYRYPLDRKEDVIAITDTTSKDTISSPAATNDHREVIASIADRFPVVLYFHNDDPDPRSWKKVTDQTYEETYARYKSLLPDYLRGRSDPERVVAFFKDHVDAGRDLLNELIDALIPALQQGEQIKLSVRGFASPLARTDYNKNLSLRRISSLVNHLRSTRNGVLAKYLDRSAENGGELVIEELPFGEERSATNVSDDLRDLEGSVYSIGAMKERRIEIQAIEFLVVRSGPEEVELMENVGDLRQEEDRVVKFKIKNEGSMPLRLTRIVADCGCTTADLPKEPIPSNGSIEIPVHFNGRAPLGPISRTVTIHTDGKPASFRLTITGEMVPD